MKLIFLEGCRRSGNHLVISWISEQAKACLQFNNYFACLEEEFDGHTFGKQTPNINESIPNIINTIHDHKNNYVFSHILISHEYPGYWSENLIEKTINMIAEKVSASCTIRLHLLRDPFNWMASYAKQIAKYKIYGLQSQNNSSIEEIADNYKRFQDIYWKRWLRSFRLWREVHQEKRIKYNTFISDADYREKLANLLSIDFWARDKEQTILTKLPPQGSSFSGYTDTFHKDVFFRFKEMLHLYRAYPIPREVFDAAKEYFPQEYLLFCEHSSADIRLY